MAIIRGTGIGKGGTKGFKPLGNGGARAAESGAAIGGAIGSIGAKVTAVQDAYLQEAENATIEAQYNDAMTRGTIKLNDAYEKRLQITKDDKGRPTYNTLIADVEESGKSVLAEIAEGIEHPSARMKFEGRFTRNIGNKQIQASAAARKQHMAFVQQSLDNGLKAQIAGAAADTIDNTAQYHEEANRMIDGAVASGAVSFEEAGKLRADATSKIRVNAYQTRIDADPTKAKAEIAMDTAKLGLTDKDKSKLDRRADAAIRSQKVKMEIDAKKKAAQIELEKQAEESKLDLEISEGTAGEDAIVAAADEKRISTAQAETLTKKLKKAEDQEIQRLESVKVIDESMTAGLAPDAKPAQVDRHYKEKLKAMGAENLKQKAAIASAYNMDVRPFRGDLKKFARGGSQQDSGDALEAYAYTMAKSPQVLSNMTQKDRAVYSLGMSLMDSTTMSPGEAMLLARDDVLGADADILKSRRKSFAKLEAFKEENLQETINDTFGLDGWFSGEKTVTPGTQATFRRLYREAYEETGSEEAAKQFVKDWSQDKYGVSGFNGDDEFMLHPPSKLIPGVSDEEMRVSLDADLAGFALEEGVEIGSIKIESDSLSSRTRVPNYGLYIEKDIGGIVVRVPLMNKETQEPVRWSPDLDAIRADKIKASKKSVDALVNEAKEIRATAAETPIEELTPKSVRKAKGLINVSGKLLK